MSCFKSHLPVSQDKKKKKTLERNATKSEMLNKDAGAAIAFVSTCLFRTAATDCGVWLQCALSFKCSFSFSFSVLITLYSVAIVFMHFNQSYIYKSFFKPHNCTGLCYLSDPLKVKRLVFLPSTVRVLPLICSHGSAYFLSHE